MCGDSHLPPAPESGDLVAIIHSTSQSTFHGRLRLSNRTPGATTSSFECASQTSSSLCDNYMPAQPLRVRIHRYGQPLSIFQNANSDTESDSEDDSSLVNPIMHSFLVNVATVSSTGDERLNLGVGDDGIVGRTVSMLDGRSKRILGEGVIGRS
ncbi:hypothetical protein EDD37DRAFT_263501 [Exophiala viscosa]|uniref:Uncharacterized protein n=1 Tax=Exophiala viscosa TaxID=2486360 RepID=A0AAN6E7Z9_9EURO|nr:hypothetical protein EDD36DRAFT_460013 [Exophiala viscosa]KAI1627498.1 hypothetical protein EDD37DRAFT_263501 [Exophiala viscosa]